MPVRGSGGVTLEPADGSGTGGLLICPPRESSCAGADSALATGLYGDSEAAAPARLPIDGPGRWPGQRHAYAALDLGTNNCRLLIARAAPAGEGQDGFRVIDSFSRIVRLGEGLSRSGE